MSLPVLLLLSLWTVQCGGCDFGWEVVKHIKTTIDSNPTGFRRVFPKNYNVEHRYTKNMLCDTDPCCVFPAAVVLKDSWDQLLKHLWEEHLNRSFILDLRQTLDKIIEKNRNAMRLQTEWDPSHFPSLSSSPEELLVLTSEFITRWLQVGCSPSIGTCTLPTLPPVVVREELPPSRARLLTTRAVSSVEEKEEERKVEDEKKEIKDEKNEEEVQTEEQEVREEERQSSRRLMDATKPPSSRAPPLLSTSLWSPLLFRLYWWLLP